MRPLSWAAGNLTLILLISMISDSSSNSSSVCFKNDQKWILSRIVVSLLQSTAGCWNRSRVKCHVQTFCVCWSQQRFANSVSASKYSRIALRARAAEGRVITYQSGVDGWVHAKRASVQELKLAVIMQLCIFWYLLIVIILFYIILACENQMQLVPARTSHLQSSLAQDQAFDPEPAKERSDQHSSAWTSDWCIQEVKWQYKQDVDVDHRWLPLI